MSIENIYFNGSFNNEMQSKYLTVYTNCIEQEKNAFISEVANILPDPEVSELKNVIEFGKAFKYGNRKVDEYYFSHALRIARFVYYNILSQNLLNTLPPAAGRSGLCAALSAALIHNCFEKNLMSMAEFSEKFGEYYCQAVDYITVDRESMKTSNGVEAHYRKLATAPLWVLGMRGLDKADNLLILHVNPDERVKREYILEIENQLIPLLKQGQSTLAEMLADECKWALSNKHEIPNSEQLDQMNWSYKPFH